MLGTTISVRGVAGVPFCTATTTASRGWAVAGSRSASLSAAVALAAPDGSIRLESEGECRGEILQAPRGEGRGYDSLFWVREAGCTYAAMTTEQRSRLGSRGKALRGIAAALRRELGLKPPY